MLGDSVGDPFKHTSGPSLNILLKLISVVALVIAPSIALSSDGLAAYSEGSEVQKQLQVQMDENEDGTVTAYVTTTTSVDGEKTVEEVTFTGTEEDVKVSLENYTEAEASVEVQKDVKKVKKVVEE